MRPRERSRPNFLERAITLLSPDWALRRRAARNRLELASRFKGSESSRLLSNWLTSLFSATPEKWELETLRARSQELNRNDSLASGITESLAVNVVGQGLRPQSRLRAEVLGIPEEEAKGLRRAAEQLFSSWSRQADAGNRLDFEEMQFLALRKVVEDGEIIAVPTWVEEPGRTLARCLELVEAERLATPTGKKGVFQGIELGEVRKEPVRYWIRKADRVIGDTEIPRYEYVGLPARDGRGRPLVLHVFPSNRPGQLRGVPWFAPLLTKFKHLADYLEAEVVAAKVAACIALVISQADPSMALQNPTLETDSASGKKKEVWEPGSVMRIGFGERAEMMDPKRPGETFPAFLEQILRLIGAALGLPYELLLKDFSKTNYSSARAALLEGRRHFMKWRGWLGRKFCQPVWELVLEEAYLRGLFPARNFYAFQEEYCRAQWIGGGWGWVDPVKEVQASKMAIDYGLSTLAEEVASQGRDWEETLEQRQREEEKIRELELTIPLGPQVTIIETGGPEDAQPQQK
jgi:lambda family phage portal protein